MVMIKVSRKSVGEIVNCISESGILFILKMLYTGSAYCCFCCSIVLFIIVTNSVIFKRLLLNFQVPLPLTKLFT